MNKIIIPLVILLVGTIAITTIPQQQTEAQEGCADPVEYDEKYLVQYCGDGQYLIDKETGEKSWSSTSGGVNKVCDPDGQCIQLSS